VKRARLLLCALLLAASAFAPAAWGKEEAISAGVVSISVTAQAYDQLLPWIKNAEQSVTGNALVARGHKLITTADLVKNSTLIEVRKFGRYPDYPARLVLVDYDLNLAVLEVDDADFWQGLKPLPLSARPLQVGHFTINRWRANGRFEQGTGEVADVLVSNSPYGLMEFPVMRGTTTMGGLGWSEVLTHDGEVIGLITGHNDQQVQALTSDLMRLLVQASERKPFGGFAHRGFAWQKLNQPSLRAYLGLKASKTGVLIRRVFTGGTGSSELHPMDILHKIGGYAIDPEGRIDHPTYGHLLFTMAINQSLAPTVPVEIERHGKRMRLELKRRRFSPDDYRVPPPQFDHANDFEVFGGMVLQELTVGYLQAWGDQWRDKAPPRLVIEYSLHSLREPGKPPERVLFISRILPDPSNVGYEDVNNAIVLGVNGRPMHSLKDFREAIRHPIGGYDEVDLLPGSGRGKLIFDAAQIPDINARVRSLYGIPEHPPGS
jgi:protease Do-like 9